MNMSMSMNMNMNMNINTNTNMNMNMNKNERWHQQNCGKTNGGISNIVEQRTVASATSWNN